MFYEENLGYFHIQEKLIFSLSNRVPLISTFLFVKRGMRPIAVNVYILFMFLAYVMRRAGTFSMEDKVKMIEYLGYMALNPNRVVNPSIANLPFLSSAYGVKDPSSLILKSSAVMTDAQASVVTTPDAAIAYTGSSIC
jgi:hypothetical protein